MARKFLQMGYTRARRYANHRSGKKYEGSVPDDKKGLSGTHGRLQLPQEPDQVKAEAAAIFKEKWDLAKQHEQYKLLMEKFKAACEQPEPVSEKTVKKDKSLKR
jgi:hypothetical protein